jgi:Tfp pilus assembly protein PilZ
MLVGRPTLLLPLRNRAAFLEQYFTKGALGGMFVPGDISVDIGEEVDVEISFVEEGVRFHTRAQVRWKREAGARRSLVPGVGIEFLPSEVKTQRSLLNFAQGKSVHHVDRAWRRFGLRLGVKTKSERGRRLLSTDDLSEGGCFLLMEEPLPVGAELEVQLKRPGAWFGVTQRATVAWRRAEQDRRGVGVAFQFHSAREQERIERIVETLKHRAVRELRVQAPRVSTPPMSVPGATSEILDASR